MTQNFQQPTDAEIARYAYYLWESEGCVQGRDIDYWLQAKAHLTTTREYEAGILSPQPATEATKTDKAAEPTSGASVSKPSRKRSSRSARVPLYV